MGTRLVLTRLKTFRARVFPATMFPGMAKQSSGSLRLPKYNRKKTNSVWVASKPRTANLIQSLWKAAEQNEATFCSSSSFRVAVTIQLCREKRFVFQTGNVARRQRPQSFVRVCRVLERRTRSHVTVRSTSSEAVGQTSHPRIRGNRI